MVKSNIPYKIKVMKLGRYAITYPHYYDVDGLDDLCEGIGSSESQFEKIFTVLAECEYVAGQQDPNLLLEQGGDCQAFAIYLKTELDRVGIPNGFIPGETHVYNWALLKGRLYKVDLTVSEVSALSLIDRGRVVKHFPELSDF